MELGFNSSWVHSACWLFGFIANLQWWFLCVFWFMTSFKLELWGWKLRQNRTLFPPLQKNLSWKVKCVYGVKCYNYKISVLCTTKLYHSIVAFGYLKRHNHFRPVKHPLNCRRLDLFNRPQTCDSMRFYLGLHKQFASKLTRFHQIV